MKTGYGMKKKRPGTSRTATCTKEMLAEFGYSIVKTYRLRISLAMSMKHLSGLSVT